MDIQKDEEARAAARAAAQPVTSDVKTPAPGRAGHWGAATGPAVKPGMTCKTCFIPPVLRAVLKSSQVCPAEAASFPLVV